MRFIEQLIFFSFDDLPYVLISLVISLTSHELSHGFAAYKLGDDTAKKQGRLTLNPLKHLDPCGTIAIILLGVGWGKPVPINYSLLRNNKLNRILVAFAGPAANLLIATASLGVWFILLNNNFFIEINVQYYTMFFKLFDYLVSINIILFIFNLIPIPPLDGYMMVKALLPERLQVSMSKLERYGLIFLVLLFITPVARIYDSVFATFYPKIIYSIENFFILIYNL